MELTCSSELIGASLPESSRGGTESLSAGTMIDGGSMAGKG